MSINKSPNINILWANLLIEELVRNGCEYFCVAPGSRSGPLAIAVAENKKVKSFVHFDERGLAFHALGYTSGSGKPSVIITTSGTAVANLFPAIIEASKKKLPLIVLTADRPPELRQTGANQTIEQVGIFGKYVRFQVDLPCPTTEISPEYVLTTIDQAIHLAKGQLPGPVHINCMYREPLTAQNSGEKFDAYLKTLKSWLIHKEPYTKYLPVAKTLSMDSVQKIAIALNKIKKGILVVGKLHSENQRAAVLKVAEKLGWPIFPDITSGLRVGNTRKNIIHHYDQILLSAKLRDKLRVDGVLHVGGRITSKRWYEFVAQANPREYITVLNHPLRNDPLHKVTLRVESPVDEFCEKILPRITARAKNTATITLRHLSDSIQKEISNFLKKEGGISEPYVASKIPQLIPKHSGLFLASSLPVREIDMYANPDGWINLLGANRGASGIDGIVASAAGFAQGSHQPTTLLIGDLALLHDLNSLSIVKNITQPLTIVVVNNDGGGIFSLLPVAEYDKKNFEKFFGTPHGLSFAAAAKMFGLDYTQVKTSAQFDHAYQIASIAKRSTLIEVTVTREATAALQLKLQKHLEVFIDSCKISTL